MQSMLKTVASEGREVKERRVDLHTQYVTNTQRGHTSICTRGIQITVKRRKRSARAN